MSWEKEYLQYHDRICRRDVAEPSRLERASYATLAIPFKSYGRDIVVWPIAKIVRPEAIELGDAVIIDDFVFLDGGEGTAFGSFIHVAVGAVICGGGMLRVGDFSNVASGVRVYTGTDDVLGSLVGPTIPAEHRNVTRTKTVIGSHCQILANSVIHAGVAMPDGVVIAPGSVVRAKDKLVAWRVYAGAPVKPIGDRIINAERLIKAGQKLHDERFR